MNEMLSAIHACTLCISNNHKKRRGKKNKNTYTQGYFMAIHIPIDLCQNTQGNINIIKNNLYIIYIQYPRGGGTFFFSLKKSNQEMTEFFINQNLKYRLCVGGGRQRGNLMWIVKGISITQGQCLGSCFHSKCKFDDTTNSKHMARIFFLSLDMVQKKPEKICCAWVLCMYMLQYAH